MPMLDLRIVEARNLPNPDWIGTPDTFCEVSLEGKQYRTSVKKDSLNPVWNEVFKFNVGDPQSSQLRFRVKGHNTIESDDFLGEYFFSISGLFRGVVVDQWVLLKSCRSNAELHIRVLAEDFGALPPGGPGTPGQPGYPPAQPGYPPAQPGYPPAQPGYPPAQPGYPPAQPGYPPAQPGYPPAQPGYPGYPPAQPGYPPAQPGYPPQGAYPSGGHHHHKHHHMLYPGNTIALHSGYSNRFLRLNGNSNQADGSDYCSAEGLPFNWGWERFTVVDAGNGEIALYSRTNGRFLRMNDGRMCDGSAPVPEYALPPEWQWERFRVVDAGNGHIALHSRAHNRFVRLNDNGIGDASDHCSAEGLPGHWAWERFRPVNAPSQG